MFASISVNVVVDVFRHDIYPFFKPLDFQPKNFIPKNCAICGIVHSRLSVNALNISNLAFFG